MDAGRDLPRAVPEPLHGLVTLALDLRWSWHHGSDALWRELDPVLWERTHNPWLMLISISGQRLEDLARDTDFIARLKQQLAAREQHFTARSWFSREVGKRFRGHIAYFSMEFGICESLPVYSGGLGVLAGDFLKTACDLDVPVVGVGLLYQRGYFRQAIDAHGEQIEFYPYNDPTMLPVTPLRNAEGEWIRIRLELPGRELMLRTWHARVGRRSLLLLDSNDPLNDPGDRGITSELYGGGPEMRLQQELVLGVGGWRLLATLGMDCPVCHLNEGHAAFAILERCRHFMQRQGGDFYHALAATRAGNLFTTHTPVAAGFDRFEPELVELYLEQLANQLGIGMGTLLALGRSRPRDIHEAFNMAWLALRGAGAVNAVSRLHADVSRHIFQPLFPRWPRAEVPVGHVTNGVHVPSWDSAAADRLWTESCGKARWTGTLETLERDLREVPDEALWAFRAQGRQRLVEYVRQRLARQQCSRGRPTPAPGHCHEVLEPDALTLGFARRFAEYKRPNLLLHDPPRLLRLLHDRDRPVQLILAGKAHPRDEAGKAMLRQWQDFITRHRVWDRVVFIEDYDLDVAARLVQGVDVWINTPRRPWEASGTSGMKVLVNGGLNLSELDGWWAEAWEPDVGWAIGDRQEHGPDRDAAEAVELYRVLEEQVVPCFYSRDEKGMPVQWIAHMRESMARLTTRFSSNRMLRQYTLDYYLPLAERYHARQQDPQQVEALRAWQQQLERHGHHIHFGNVQHHSADGAHHFEVQVYLDDVPADAVQVELYAEDTQAGAPLRQPMARGETLAGSVNGHVYRARVPADRPATHYTPRVIPRFDGAAIPLESPFIVWHH